MRRNHCLTRQQIGDVFEEVGLTIGGLVATHEVPGPFVTRLFHSLGELHERAIHQAEDAGEEDRDSREPSLVPHPAVAHFLQQIRRP